MNDRCSLLVHEYAMIECPDEPPPLLARLRISAFHPGAAALAYERTMAVVFRYVFGYDIVRRKLIRRVVPEQALPNVGPEKEGRVVGVVRAFACATETQARGSLHGHSMLWVRGGSDVLLRIQKAAAAHFGPDGLSEADAVRWGVLDGQSTVGSMQAAASSTA